MYCSASSRVDTAVGKEPCELSTIKSYIVNVCVCMWRSTWNDFLMSIKEWNLLPRGGGVTYVRSLIERQQCQSVRFFEIGFRHRTRN